MGCQSCGSVHTRPFGGEVAIHFPGLDGLNKPIVWVFPKLTVCLDCGVTQFIIPEKELQVLVTGATVDATVVWAESSKSRSIVGEADLP